MGGRGREVAVFILLAASVSALFIGLLFCGQVHIAPGEIWALITGNESSEMSRVIVLESRLPMAVTAMFAGASLSVAGLLLQSCFRNPLAGPSLLGVSSGASLGVAIVTLCAAPMLTAAVGAAAARYLTELTGALVGAAAVIVLLLLFSSILRGAIALLITGVMMGYLASSVISLLNFFAPAEGIRSFVLWGMGSFSGVTAADIPFMTLSLGGLLLLTLFGAKPLDAMLLGDRYLISLGYNERTLRGVLLTLSGLLTAIVTALCGPVGFIGMIVPHIARMALRTSVHRRLLPATMLAGAATGLLCAMLSVLPARTGVIPVNAITPVLGVPVILYLLTRGRSLRQLD